MINDLLSELDQLAQRNRELLHRVRAAKAALRDTTTSGNPRIREQPSVVPKPSMREFLADGPLPDRRARASSCIIPPSLQLRIGGGSRSVESVLLSPYQRPSVNSASPHKSSGSHAGPQTPRHQRSMTLPDLHKPLPPTPVTPQWPLSSPTANIKSSPLCYDCTIYSTQLDDESALLLNNISLESEATSQLPFVPGQSYMRLPRRTTEEALPRNNPSASPPPPGSSPPQKTALSISQQQLGDPGVIALNTTPALEPQTPANPSSGRRLKKRFEDYLPRGILQQKPKHERARTLSPSRTPSQRGVLTMRAKSTHDLKRGERKGVRFADQ